MELGEFDSYGAQFAGVQLLRGHQWIETLGAVSEFADIIPMEYRRGFIGFVEFERTLEGRLRTEAESPQHDAFRRNLLFVKQIHVVIRSAVQRFAEAQGWVTETPEQTSDDAAADIVASLARLFVNKDPGRGPGGDEDWDCSLELDFPNPDTTRVNWGQPISNVVATCGHPDELGRQDVKFDLILVAPDGSRQVIATRSKRSSDGSALVDFGDFRVMKSVKTSGEISCDTPGRYRLVVECESGTQSLNATRNILVQEDPTGRPARDYSVGIAVSNLTAERERVNYGDSIALGVVATNRTNKSATLYADVSLESLLLGDRVKVELEGRPAGDIPASKMLTYTVLISDTGGCSNAAGDCVEVAPGRHFVRVDLRDENNVVVAHASKAINVEIEADANSLPFRVEADEVGEYPIWALGLDPSDATRWVLTYSKKYPVYKAAAAGDAAGAGAVFSTSKFITEICCEGLVEWALTVFRQQGDEQGMTLLTPTSEQMTKAIWATYGQRVEKLFQVASDPSQSPPLQREVSSLMHIILLQA